MNGSDGDEPGKGEVHAHIRMGPGDAETGDFVEGEDPLTDSPPAGARARFASARGRTYDRMAGATGRATGLLERAGSRLEERTGVVSMAKESPLAAVGIAFAVGFLLAGGGSERTRLGKARHRLRGLIVAGLGAALLEEAREFLNDEGGPVGMFGAILGIDDDGEDLAYEDE